MFLRFRCFRYSRVSTWSKFHEKQKRISGKCRGEGNSVFHSFGRTPFVRTDKRQKTDQSIDAYIILRCMEATWSFVSSCSIIDDHSRCYLEDFSEIKSVFYRRFLPRSARIYRAEKHSQGTSQRLDGRRPLPIINPMVFPSGWGLGAISSTN